MRKGTEVLVTTELRTSVWMWVQRLFLVIPKRNEFVLKVSYDMSSFKRGDLLYSSDGEDLKILKIKK